MKKKKVAKSKVLGQLIGVRFNKADMNKIKRASKSKGHAPSKWIRLQITDIFDTEKKQLSLIK